MSRTVVCIETSTDVCSAAVCRGEEVLSFRLSEAGVNHSQVLPLYIESLIGECREKGWHLDGVAVSSGPGSYTGLRIGVSTAKGLAYGWHLPLVGVPTLLVLCERALSESGIPEDALLCPMIDARRMEVYTAMYDKSLGEQMSLRAQVVEDGLWLPKKEIYYFGNGAAKCEGVMTATNLHLLKDIQADARFMGRLAARYIEEGQTADVAYFEPFYLKEFVAAPSHIKGL